jgi:glycine cleavage system H protein
MKVPEGLHYTKDHEWVKIKEDSSESLNFELTIGITDFAQDQLGDIVYLEVDTEGDLIEAEEVFGSIEAVKTVSDLFMPVTATITEVNEKLTGDPEILNSDPYEEGWIIKATILKENITLDDLTSNLLSYKEYKDLTI